MNVPESLTRFYQRHGQPAAPTGQCTVFRIEEGHRAASPHNRRDFYKVMLLTTANGWLRYADQSLAVHDNALVFTNPLLPYSWERVSGCETGVACLFTEEFVTPQLKTVGVAASPLFQLGGPPVLQPPAPTSRLLRGLFEQLLTEWQGSYIHKHELLRSYLQLILHESLKLAPVVPARLLGTSSARLTTLFLDLLGRQFPITSLHQRLALRNARDYAQQLAVHANHLNRTVKETTGKTTTQHLVERLLQEAKALLRHSDWPIAEVGHCLGFDYAANFNIFFRRHTQQTPAQFRRQLVATA